MPSFTSSVARSRLARLSLPVAVSLGAGVTVAAAGLMERRDRVLQEREFERRTRDATAALNSAFSVPAEVALSLPAFIGTHATLDLKTFARFTQPTLQRHPAIAALEWMPLVEDQDRADFETRHGIAILEPDTRGNMVRAARRDRYFPILFSTPEIPGVMGLDVGFEPFRQRMLSQALTTTGAFVTERFQLVEDPAGVHSIALYGIVTLDNGAPRSFDNVRGLSVALFRLRPVVEEALRDINLTGIRYSLQDAQAAPEARILHEGGDLDVPEDTRLRRQHEWSYINRVWRVQWWGQPASLRQTRTSVIMLASGLLLTAALVAAIQALRRADRLARQFEAHRKLGNYTLLHKLGEGGMGSVYLARHALLRRPTAVKIIREAVVRDAATERDAEARFEREVQLTSQLTHPNTIAVFDYGRSEDGRFYYAMEYIHGLSLGSVVTQDGPFSPRRAVHLLKQVCGSLAEAHALGLIHRDIKPDNVMIANRGGVADFVKVLDFGLVKGLDTKETLSSQGGRLVGTPGYIAPETLLSGQVDPRSDVYSVGALLLYVLTGAPAYAGETPMAVISKALAGPPEISTASLDPASRELVELALLCMGSLEHRPHDAGALLTALDRVGYEPWSNAEASAWWDTRGNALLAMLDGSQRVATGATLLVDMSASGRFR